MSATPVNTTFFHVTWSTAERRPLFDSLEQRRAAQLWVCEIAKAKGLRAHQVRGQGVHLHVLFEMPAEIEPRAEELFASIKSAVERALLTINPELSEVWDEQGSCERADSEELR
jgi:hypothetical protein